MPQPTVYDKAQKRISDVLFNNFIKAFPGFRGEYGRNVANEIAKEIVVSIMEISLKENMELQAELER